ncbi:hypothetical protein L1987_01212 [Smallanthus sonchifolius]|uniref:Uncharacterized protein n=1 Tax=Smallanthus sonchifolius TaxID=185202 RepID=A0ACB9K4G8_9ASTR|nr:hypothetical protein L1987_01212 [Smallanthus sonchifolius]
MNKILKELHESCQRADEKKGTRLLDVYAIEIQLYTKTKNNKTLKVKKINKMRHAEYIETMSGGKVAADRAYVDKKKWNEMSILCTAGSARFSSDRTIEDYAEKNMGNSSPVNAPFNTGGYIY